MLTLKDCLDFCELTEDEIHAIAEHERLPEIVAAELGTQLLESKKGQSAIQRYIRENIRSARSHGRLDKARHLSEVLAQFTAAHSCSEKR
jgi:hypothetical protein